MVSAHSHRVSRVPWYSGSCTASSDFGYGALTLFGRLSQSRSPVLSGSVDAVRTPQCMHRGVPLRTLWIHVRMTVVRTAGFPHSDISGSMDMCSSPKLFAAYHVFHRLSVPRHPPCALFCLTSLIPCLSFLPDRKGGLPPCRPSVSGGRLHVDTCFFMVRVSPNLNLPLFWENLPVFFTENIQNSLMSFSLGIIKKTLLCAVFKVHGGPFRSDGLKWTRTTDLTLIRRAL